tara:strand:+ start:4653 stop:5435 length:783 start_codon:yes stop_codon:yes gene_type:complete
MKIIVAGYGPVGQAVYHALEQHPGDIDVFIDDPDKGYHYTLGTWMSPVEAVIVCVATPALSDGRCDTSNVAAVLDKYSEAKILIKSAVDPLWLNDKVTHPNVTYSPEFLGGSNMNREPVDEFMDQKFAIYGGADCRWWHELFKPCLPLLEDVRFVSLQQAAFAKYVENCYLATKVTFFNEMYNIYQSCGFQGFDAMVEAICLDPRIGMSHTQVPGPDGQYGFGGHCFPKDIACLKTVASDVGYDADFLEQVINSNDNFRD